MARKKFKVYFYQLSLYDGNNTGYNLDLFLSDYCKNMESVTTNRQGECATYLEKVENLGSRDEIILSYANFKYGEEKDIVNMKNMTKKGTLQVTDSLKDAQYIALTKKKENIYNACIQTKREGLNAGSFLYLLNYYLSELKIKDSSKTQIQLMIKPFYPIDFFEKLNSLNSRRIVVEGGNFTQQDHDVNFSEKYNTRISQKIVITPAKRNVFFKKNENLADHLKDLCKDYDTVKLNAIGKDEDGEEISIYSERCQASEEKKIKVDEKGNIDYNAVIDTLQDFLEKLKIFKGVLM